ncbi:MAG: hypothetical protein ABMA64_15560 [Myxococcota bacterium]
MLLAAACSNSGLGRTSVPESAETGTPTNSELKNCPWKGTWELAAVKCGEFDFGAWYDDHSGATLEIDHDPEGGCAVVAQVAGPTCTRTEAWRLSVPLGSNVEATYDGVTACEPESCTFSTSEPTCAPGELTGGATVEIDAAGGELLVNGLLVDTAPSCTLDLKTTWASAR